MMPLTLLAEGETARIAKVGGRGEIKQHLADLGFVPNAEITVVSKVAGNFIVLVKETRVAIGKEMAQKIII